MQNQFSVTPLGGLDFGAALQQQQQLDQQQAQIKQQEQQQAKMAELSQAASKGDADAIGQLWGMNPEFANMFEKREAAKVQELGAKKAYDSKRAEIDWGLRYKQSTTPEQKQQLLQEALSNPLIDIDEDDLTFNEDGNNFAVNAMLFNHLGKDAYKAVLEQQQVGEKLPSEAVSFNDLIKDFTPAQKKDAKLIKAGLKGRVMNNAMTSALQNGNFDEFKQASSDVKQAEKFAEMTGSSRAKAIDNGFESIVKIDAGISNIDRAINAVKSGAGVGAVEKLWPSIKASSVLLDNIRGDMALDVVGATTFGALSKGELDLAKDIALPTGLNTQELTDYLVKKKAAQEKLRSYYNEQIQFLDQGGTVAGFLRKKEREISGSNQGQQNQTSQPMQSPVLGQSVTPEQIQSIMQKTGLPEQEVRKRLGL